eukprot:195280_1
MELVAKGKYNVDHSSSDMKLLRYFKTILLPKIESNYNGWYKQLLNTDPCELEKEMERNNEYLPSSAQTYDGFTFTYGDKQRAKAQLQFIDKPSYLPNEYVAVASSFYRCLPFLAVSARKPGMPQTLDSVLGVERATVPQSTRVGTDERGRPLHESKRGAIYYFRSTGSKVYVTRDKRTVPCIDSNSVCYSDFFI